jgi:prepilin-type N-terminal cleavage/methylation domain-containing protein
MAMTGRKKKWHGERGVTLIEVLIASLLTAIVVAATMEFYVSQHKSWLMQTDVAEVQQNARVCVDEIAGVLRMAGYRLDDNHPAFLVGADSLTVYFVEEATGDIDTIRYFVSEQDALHPRLYRQHKNGTPELFGEDIESLDVTQLSPRLLEVGITARSGKPDTEFLGLDGYRRRSYVTHVSLRNL